MFLKRPSLVAVLFGLTLAGAAAQTPKPVQYPPPGTVLRQLFPKPTGLNGYEDLVLAGEWIRGHKLLDAAQAPNATLTLKRRALSDPKVARARRLLRQGLSKPIQSPHKEIDVETYFPQYALFRNLARLLAVEQYVLLADGKVGQAIDSLRDGLKLGYLIQSDTLISGLVGIAVDAIVLQRLARHMDQWSARDCERLVALANEWLNQPNPVARVFAAERDMALRMVGKLRSDANAVQEITGGLDDFGLEDDPRARELAKQIKENPAVVGQMLDRTTERIRSHFDALLASLRLPYWERPPMEEARGDSPYDILYEMLIPAMLAAMDRYAQEQATVQLLGVHAAIRRYRWEHDRLPNSLDELKVGRLAIDPFTGQPLVYRRIGDSYELYSAGPLDRGTEEKPPSGGRVPVYLPRKQN